MPLFTFIIVWAFIAYGMTTIIVYGSIFEKQRLFIKDKSKFFGDLIGCVMCTSTWVGFLMSIFLGGMVNAFVDTNIIFRIFFDGMFTCGVVWAINAIIEFFEEYRNK